MNGGYRGETCSQFMVSDSAHKNEFIWLQFCTCLVDCSSTPLVVQASNTAEKHRIGFEFWCCLLEVMALSLQVIPTIFHPYTHSHLWYKCNQKCSIFIFWEDISLFWLFSCRIKMNHGDKEIHAKHPLVIDKLWIWWHFLVPHHLYQKNTRNSYHLSSVLQSYSPISHPKCCVKLRLWWVQPTYLTPSPSLAWRTLFGQKQTAPEPQLVNTSVVGISWIQRGLLMLLVK